MSSTERTSAVVIRVANYFRWFYAVSAGLINAITHFVSPILKGGYFPGLSTAGGHLLLSALTLAFLVQEARTLKAHQPISTRALPLRAAHRSSTTRHG